MSDEGGSIEAEAARLREKRLLEQKQLEDRKNEFERKRAEDRVALRPSRIRASLSRPFLHFVAFGFAMGAMPFLSSEDGDVRGIERPGGLAGFIAVLGVAVLIEARYLFSIQLDRMWRKRLPFQVTGFEEALGTGEFTRAATLQVTFKDKGPDPSVLREILVARVPGSELSGERRHLSIRSPELASEVSNWPVAGWSRRVVKRVLLDVHRDYPIVRVELAVTQRGEYHVPSGD